MKGNNVAHSKLRTKRDFSLNLKTKKFWSEEEQRYTYGAKDVDSLVGVKLHPGKGVYLLDFFPGCIFAYVLEAGKRNLGGNKRRYHKSIKHRCNLQTPNR